MKHDPPAQRGGERYSAAKEALRILESGSFEDYKSHRQVIRYLANKGNFEKEFPTTYLAFERMVENERSNSPLFEGLTELQQQTMQLRIG